MDSMGYVRYFTYGLLGIIDIFAVLRCIYISMQMGADGEPLNNILKKVKKVLFSAIIANCLLSLVPALESYF